MADDASDPKKWIVKFPGERFNSKVYHTYKDCSTINLTRSAPHPEETWRTIPIDSGKLVEPTEDVLELLQLTECNVCAMRRVDRTPQDVIAELLRNYAYPSDPGYPIWDDDDWATLANDILMALADQRYELTRKRVKKAAS